MSETKYKIPKRIIYTLSSFLLLGGLLTIYYNSCSYGFQFNAHRYGLVGEEIINGTKIVLKDEWFPLWISNVVTKSDSSSYPSITFALKNGCESNNFMNFYKLPDNYFQNNDFEQVNVEYKKYSWGNLMIKDFNLSGRVGIKGKMAFSKEHSIAIDVTNLEDLDNILSIEEI